jgi:hypothetical protein
MRMLRRERRSAQLPEGTANLTRGAQAAVSEPVRRAMVTQSSGPSQSTPQYWRWVAVCGPKPSVLESWTRLVELAWATKEARVKGLLGQK